jgi:hypothetical protein
MDLSNYIRDIPDFPKPGIVFKDITPLLLEPAAFDHAVRQLADATRPLDVEPSAARLPVSWESGSSPLASRASCRTRPSASNTPSSTESINSRCTQTP